MKKCSHSWTRAHVQRAQGRAQTHIKWLNEWMNEPYDPGAAQAALVINMYNLFGTINKIVFPSIHRYRLDVLYLCVTGSVLCGCRTNDGCIIFNQIWFDLNGNSMRCTTKIGEAFNFPHVRSIQHQNRDKRTDCEWREGGRSGGVATTQVKSAKRI